MTHGSTFSGIGAPEVAAEMLGWENVFHCEINPFGRGVLEYYYPESKSYEDITRTDFSEWRGRIDVLTGGFPCQPFSYAGKRRGSEDDRYLWPYMLRCIRQVRPTWFVGENVAGIATMVFPGKDVKVGSGGTIFDETDYMERDERYVIEEICQQLEDIGYSVQPVLIPALAVGAPHRRDRIFFVAHRDAAEDPLCFRCSERESQEQGSGRNNGDTCTGDTQRIRGKEGAAVRPVTDTVGGGSGTQKAGGRTEREGSDRLSQQSQRRDQTQRTDGLSPLQGDALHPYGCQREERLQYGKRNENQEEDSAGVDGGVARFGGKRTSPDPERRHLQDCGPHTGDLAQENSGREAGGYMYGSLQGIENLLPENRWRTFPTVSPVHRGNDGIPFDVDCLTIPFGRWKRESLKAYGNAIVVQVMYEIFRAIELTEKQYQSMKK